MATLDSVTIEKLVFGGAGLGYADGKACFVPFSAPGDTLAARVLKEKPSYREAEILEMLQPGSVRTPPECAVFGLCGGCNWQHVAYDHQLAGKSQIFTDFLRRTARVDPGLVLPALPSPDPYNYRSRVQLKVRNVNGNLHIGFYRSGSHFVIDISDNCPLVVPAIANLMAPIRGILASCPDNDKIPQVDISAGDDGRTIVIVHYIGERLDPVLTFLRDSYSPEISAGLFLQVGRKSSLRLIGGDDSLSYRFSNLMSNGRTLELSFSRGGFSQVNYPQNLRMVEFTLDCLCLTGRERILDVYCGNGNFSIPLSFLASEVVGLEVYEPSVRDAVRNAAVNGAPNVGFRCADAGEELKRLATAGEKFDIVLLDPPRKGASDILGHIVALAPRAILYVSCDPATLARDLGTLAKSGYGVIKSRPIDMFPQTYHIESVTLLEQR